MANIQERTSKDGNVTYRVQVRLKGYPPQSATFDRKNDANRWISETEAALREGRYFKSNESRKRTLEDLVDRHIEDVLPSKSASMRRDQKQQLAWWKSRIGQYTLADVSPPLIGDQRDYLTKNGSGLRINNSRSKPPPSERRDEKATDGEQKKPKLPSPATVVRYLAALSSTLSHAVDELGWIDAYPMAKVKKPREAKGQIRFLSDDERVRLPAACQKSDNRCLYPVVLMAICTAARSSEIINLDWSRVDFNGAKATLITLTFVSILPFPGTTGSPI